MKRLLVCLLLVGVVGCGEKEPAKETLSNEVASPDQLVEQPSGNPLPGSATEKPRSAEDVADALKTIALAFRNRAGVHRGFNGHNPRWFDKEGRPYLSWRVHLLPFAGERSLFREFRLEESWDSQHNKALLDRMPEIYKTAGVNRSGYTSMLTFTGRSTPFDDTRRRTGGMWQLLSPYSGPIPDGQSDTILVIEAGTDKAVPWTKPDDLTPDFDKPWECLGKVGDHIHVVFIDGSVLRLPTTLEDTHLKALITPAGGETESDQTPEVPASSTGRAEEIPPVPAIDSVGEFVHDLAGVLYIQDVPEGQHKTIQDAQEVAFKEHNTPIIVVTIHRMMAYGYSGQEIQPFAEKWFNKWQIGTLDKSAAGHNRGILLIVSVGDRKGRIELGADWGRRFDGTCQQIMDNVMIPHFKRGDYAAGIAAGVEALGKMAAAGQSSVPAEPPTTDSESPEPEKNEP